MSVLLNKLLPSTLRPVFVPKRRAVWGQWMTQECKAWVARIHHVRRKISVLAKESTNRCTSVFGNLFEQCLMHPFSHTQFCKLNNSAQQQYCQSKISSNRAICFYTTCTLGAPAARNRTHHRTTRLLACDTIFAFLGNERIRMTLRHPTVPQGRSSSISHPTRPRGHASVQ